MNKQPRFNSSQVTMDLDNDYSLKKEFAKLFATVCRNYEEHNPHILPMVKSKKRVMLRTKNNGKKVDKLHLHLISYCFGKIDNKERKLLKTKNKEVFNFFLEIERRYPGNIILGSKKECFENAKKKYFS